ncbi:hypothetical protein HanXRQr2_Chr16g0758631 [Helianthus annuus]|uniref:Uncharacterized protein n=1 Tax=Helianthus annuus TaxID=4232 RepID=A0A251S189_HELAN|nr:hypothetical protein HanXRQr2_Chr16g0758631 [Helianthus annuus]KAJ0438834.1 hypothetical protein HanHA300_Chr16g0618591 [Helianthus annuus]KAJ0443743.1 hypothetical protein HanIR_Chr16g0824171 [Helianthus annuus]KAJ0461185.1 hypothetical protein HanHA89_Chr16g0669481 [Helianthus annuus]KAJ0645493.1 hypothetical protein HanOQP8_Chr16g0624561 [Helianthus annuus]
MAEEQPQPNQIKHIHKLNLFKIKGRDKHNRKILRIIGKNFPAKSFATSLTVDLLKKKYLGAAMTVVVVVE